MVVIRLARGGARNRPFYNIVVADSQMPRDGRFIERIGFLDVKAPDGAERYRIALDRVEHWVKQGAKPSDAVMKLVRDSRRKIAAPAA